MKLVKPRPLVADDIDFIINIWKNKDIIANDKEAIQKAIKHIKTNFSIADIYKMREYYKLNDPSLLVDKRQA